VRDGDKLLVNVQTNEKSSIASRMVDLRFEISAGVQRAALAPTGLTRECAGGQLYFAPEVMMSSFLQPAFIRKGRL
jgi:hypothetical protein